jgi:hypothetical protein
MASDPAPDQPAKYKYATILHLRYRGHKGFALGAGGCLGYGHPRPLVLVYHSAHPAFYLINYDPGCNRFQSSIYYIVHTTEYKQRELLGFQGFKPSGAHLVPVECPTPSLHPSCVSRLPSYKPPSSHHDKARLQETPSSMIPHAPLFMTFVLPES